METIVRPWNGAELSAIAETLDRVVVDHSGGLHESVADGRADEVEAAFLQVFAHRVRLQCARRNFLAQPPDIHARLAADKSKDAGPETGDRIIIDEANADEASSLRLSGMYATRVDRNR